MVLAPKSLAPVHFEASFKRDWDLDLPEKWCQKVHKHTKWDFFECLLQVFLKFNPPPPQKNNLFGSTKDVFLLLSSQNLIIIFSRPGNLKYPAQLT